MSAKPLGHAATRVRSAVTSLSSVEPLPLVAPVTHTYTHTLRCHITVLTQTIGTCVGAIGGTLTHGGFA